MLKEYIQDLPWMPVPSGVIKDSFKDSTCTIYLGVLLGMFSLVCLICLFYLFRRDFALFVFFCCCLVFFSVLLLFVGFSVCRSFVLLLLVLCGSFVLCCFGCFAASVAFCCSLVYCAAFVAVWLFRGALLRNLHTHTHIS